MRAAIVVMLSWTAACAFAGDGGSADEPSAPVPPIGQTQAAASAAYNQQVVCTKEQVLGSRIPKEVCRTRAQTDAEIDGAQKYVERVQAGARGQSTSAH